MERVEKQVWGNIEASSHTEHIKHCDRLLLVCQFKSSMEAEICKHSHIDRISSIKKPKSNFAMVSGHKDQSLRRRLREPNQRLSHLLTFQKQPETLASSITGARNLRYHNSKYGGVSEPGPMFDDRHRI
jgi:hypothetical protein